MARISGNNLTVLKDITNTLSKGGVVSAAAEAETLLLHFGKMTRTDLYADTKHISPATLKKIYQAIRKRVAGTPLQYMTGIAGFYGHDFFVSPAVLVPRPETEILVAESLSILARIPKEGILKEVVAGDGEGESSSDRSLPQDRRGRKSAAAGRTRNQNVQILDIGTGSGCIAVSLTISRPDCRMTALDISTQALFLARKNARSHLVGDRIAFRQSDLLGVFKGQKQGFWDMIVSNPPYISLADMKRLPKDVCREPRRALLGGRSGLEIITRLVGQAPSFLKPGGYMLIEFGDDQAAGVKNILAGDGRYQSIRFVKDRNGIERVAVAERSRKYI